VTAAGLLSVVLATSLSGQTTVPDQGVLRVDSRLVLVDVVVRGDDGPTLGLDVDDFSIFDDGAERQIAVFTAASAAVADSMRPLPAGTVSNRRSASGRAARNVTLILLDRLNTPILEQMRADQQLRKFLETVGPDDRIAIYELGERLTVLQNFTDDPRQLPRNPDLLRPKMFSSVVQSLGGSVGRTFSSDRARVSREELPLWQGNVRFMETANALEMVALHLSDMPGRKSLVWLAGSFPFSYWGFGASYDQNRLFYDRSMYDELERTALILSDANVAVYPVRTEGLTGRRPDGISVMRSIADTTGGRATYSSNGLAEAMMEAVDDAAATYTLGFYPGSGEADGSYHELEVRVRQPDVKILHRDGYYDFTNRPAQEQWPSPAELLASPLNATSLGLLARVDAGNEPDAYALTAVVDINDVDLRYENDEWVGGILLTLHFDPEGEGEGWVFPPVQLSIRIPNEAFESVVENGYVLSRLIETRGDTGRLHVIVQDFNQANAGSVWLDLD
jgi:VWFA-related protein